MNCRRFEGEATRVEISCRRARASRLAASYHSGCLAGRRHGDRLGSDGLCGSGEQLHAGRCRRLPRRQRLGCAGELGVSGVPRRVRTERQTCPIDCSADRGERVEQAAGRECSAGSEGLLTLSANGEYLIETGYDAVLGTAKVGETTDTSVPRTIGRVSASGEVNTSTALPRRQRKQCAWRDEQRWQ